VTDLLLGIDVGTSACKAAIVDAVRALGALGVDDRGLAGRGPDVDAEQQVGHRPPPSAGGRQAIASISPSRWHGPASDRKSVV